MVSVLADLRSWHNDSFTSDWMNSLLGITLNSSKLVHPSTPVPNATEVAPLMKSLYRQLFALLLGLNPNIFLKSETAIPITAEAMVVESRIFVSTPMFAISTAILLFHLIIAILYYTHRPKKFLPRMPTSIASIIAFVSASRALQDFSSNDTQDVNSEELRYGYGRFIGTDGKTHVGIERQRYVVPLKSKNPSIARRRWGTFREEKDEKQPRTWI